MIIWLTQVNMIILMTVMYVLMDNIECIQTYDSSGCVNCGAGKYVSGSSASDHASESNCKYADEAHIAMTELDLALVCVRENT